MLLRTGLSCLEQDNASEILAAARALSRNLSGQGPASINLSMGTHVGPHDGQTRLEAFVAGFTSTTGPTFMHVAAGNHGEAGYHATMNLQASVSDVLVLDTGPGGSNELLVEFWWEEHAASSPGFLNVEVEVLDPTGVSVFVRKLTLRAVSPDPFGRYVLSAPRHAHDRRQSLVPRAA